MERWCGAPNNWVECNGIRLESNIAIFIVLEMCKALLDAGYPDGSIVFYEDGYIEPSWSYPSIQEVVQRLMQEQKVLADMRSARAPRQTKPKAVKPTNLPNVSDRIKEALTALAEDAASWNRMHGRTRSILLDQGFIKIEDGKLKVTEAGDLVMGMIADDVYPKDISKADPEQLLKAAKTIGLKSEDNLSRNLMFIEANVSRYSLLDLEERAYRVLKANVRTNRFKSDIMRKRRILAAIANAGKLAEAL